MLGFSALYLASVRVYLQVAVLPRSRLRLLNGRPDDACASAGLHGALGSV